MFKSFLDDVELPKFCAKCFSLSKNQILGVFFGFVCEKNLKGWSDRLETWHAKTGLELDPVLKEEKKQKTLILSRQPFIVNLIFEIHKYFPNIFITWIRAKILGFLF